MEPHVVHEPASWRKLKKAIKAARGGPVFYKSACTGARVQLPPAVRVCKDDDAAMMGGGHYFVCGPDPAYYVKCEDCSAI